jgi:quercetin dioxygenase-like cupin family protein
MESYPFEENTIGEYRMRTFSNSVETEELKWHFDDENRLVEVIESNGWLLQMDDELPIKLIRGESYFIPQGVYHRVIKGDGDLVIKITVTQTIQEYDGT